METQQNLEVSKHKLNAGFFFLCLGLLITLITSVVSLLNLIFNTLDKQFPDVLNSTYQYGYSTYDYEGIRSALATFIIFFPIFLVVSYFWRKFIKKGDLGNIDEVIKKWVVYIVLFLSALTTAIDLVVLVKYFVSGEITNRFILKVISTLILAALVGTYYILFLRNKEEVKLKKISLIFGIVGIIIFFIAIFYSFSIMGSPAKQRLLRFDEKKISDLQSIQYQVINYWQQKEKLPEDLKSLVNPMTGFSMPVPPDFQNGEKYEYVVINNKKLEFELCATFSLPIPEGWQSGYGGGGVIPMIGKEISTTNVVSGGVNESWNHDAGRTCFSRTIDKDIYPPFSKTKN